MFQASLPQDSAAVAPPPARPSRWDRTGLAVLLIGTAVMYLWNITVNGMGNQFYAGAAQAGSRNWEALLFGSLDSANFITVDKPPVSQWVMGLSGQLFGFSSASMLIPEALMAVATVALLYAAVARICGPRAGLLAGAALALTPVAALMFRFNNPDAAMVLLMMASAYCTVRALERASGKWLAWAGVALGFAFLAKMLEGLLVVPAVGVVYLLAAPTTLRTRILHLLGAMAAFLVSAGWFVVLTLVWPASSRPYIAGSTDNSFMDLVLGYNGVARVAGGNHMNMGPSDPLGNSVGNQLRHAGGFGGMDQHQGLSRLFAGEFGFEIGWLIPAALLALVLVLISRGRAARTDDIRAGALLFGAWLVIDGLLLSYMKGMVHPYYCLSLAPAVAGTVAIGAHEMWEHRQSRFGRIGSDRAGCGDRCLELVGTRPQRRLAAGPAVDDPGRHRARRRGARAVLTGAPPRHGDRRRPGHRGGPGRPDGVCGGHTQRPPPGRWADRWARDIQVGIRTGFRRVGRQPAAR